MADAATVIGASGFLGSALTAELERSGEPVAEYTRSVPFLSQDGVLDRGIAEARTVFWLASSINPAVAESRPDRVVADRREFAALISAIRLIPKPPRLVLISSGGTVYDPTTPPPYSEDAPVRPRGAYGRAKLDLEALLAGADLPPGQAVTLRIANAYGPGQPAVSGQGVVAYWLRSAVRGEPLVVYGEPETTRDYLHVDDITQALLAVHRATAALPPILNIGSGRPTTLRELALTVLDVAADPRLRLSFEPARTFDVPRTWLDIGLAAATLGWRPAVSLRDGIGSTWQSIRSALDGIPRQPYGPAGSHPDNRLERQT
jgi:UDP-glucose 4-epimerase